MMFLYYFLRKKISEKRINNILRLITNFVKKIVKSIPKDTREDAILATLFVMIMYLLDSLFTPKTTIISLLFVWYFAMIIFRIVRQQEQRKNKNEKESESIEDLVQYLKKASAPSGISEEIQ